MPRWVQCCVISYFGSLFDASYSVILSRFRPKEISFFRENSTPASMPRPRDSCFDAFSSREPVPTSLENAYALKTALFFLDQNFAFAGVIGLADDAFEFHSLHQGCRAVVADLQPALNIGSRGLAVA